MGAQVSHSTRKGNVSAFDISLENTSAVDLSFKQLTKIPKEVQQKCLEIQELDLSLNRGIRLDNAIGCFNNLRKLWLRCCKLSDVPDEIGTLTKLEVLDLSYNEFKNGIDPSIGRLHNLKKLTLRGCGMQALPDSFWNLEELEELDLSDNNYKKGVPPIGRLHHLKKLDLSGCDLQNIPDLLWDLEELEELNLSHNNYESGINPSIKRLRHLKKLSLQFCNIQTLTGWFCDLEELEELDLSYNKFKNGIDPSIGRLHHLKTLNLGNCGMQALPDSFLDLEELTTLHLQSNCFTEYPSCLHNMKNLKILDLSYQSQGQRRNRITSLPMELAETNLRVLILNDNPITVPPEAIWQQGLDAIKSYLREKRLGAAVVCPDTINIIGDVSAGKTSIAWSLVQRSPQSAAEDDRTRVMQQLRAGFGEDGKLLVNINDFGGHQIYHCVIPIFLPTDGLTLLAYDMSLPDKDQKETVSRWLLTVIAKLKNIRVIVAGTRCDKLSRDQRKYVETNIRKYISSVLNGVKLEIHRHIRRLQQRTSNSDWEKQIRLQCLLLSLESADISVVSLSCRKPDPGLKELHDIVSEKLRQGDSMPLRWFRIMKSILHESSNRPYLTWSEVQKLYRVEVPDGDGDKDLIVILRYLVRTSQIIWLERHEKLKKFIFHSPLNMLKTCKDVLSHDHLWHVASHLVDVTDKDRERYVKGIVRQPFMMKLISDTKSAAVSIEFLKNFNLISEIRPDDGTRTFVIPSNLPAEEPRLMRDLEQRLHSCPNSVVINLIFHGSVVPMSFFETCLSSMLTIAMRIFKDEMSTEQWRHGLIILYDRVRFSAKRCNNILTLTAFSEVWTSNPWAVLLPVIEGIDGNITASWHGARPESSLLCPACRISRRLKAAFGENEIALETLVFQRQHEVAKWMCPKCAETIPLCLCFPLPRESLTADEQYELMTFFTKHGMTVFGGVSRSSASTNAASLQVSTGMTVSGGVSRSSASTNAASLQVSAEKDGEYSELIRKLRKATPTFVDQLDRQSILAIVDALQAARDGAGLITVHQTQLIQAERTDIDMARKLLSVVLSRGDEAIRELGMALQSDRVKLPHLAKLILG